ncbi:TonB-dependent receptor [Ferruginibacter albus]|uniref:TonB-dependent receptor n=1 Tax=Ferruginibacter albus TaxID=2875540 RepID=UPI001CC49EE6|nr:carboxypeptidase-like regulatory domain-containing protein [Ferruginibacter albus]UAY52904.1 TonB-dependent receptor [Ferruginibacter albus]
MRILTTLVLSFFVLIGAAQKKFATVSGKIVDENENPLAKVSVVILGNLKHGEITNDSGYFKIKVPSNEAFALVFSCAGYNTFQKNFLLSTNENETVGIRMEKGNITLTAVTVSSENIRTELGKVDINPKNAVQLPSTIGGVEGLIKILVGSNSELTSQYSVRGGNYDENLIYINDFEVFRPYLVNNGQQEGLSLINPDLARNVSFYNGGFSSKYGDKMSSVLDIQYKKPKSFGGSVSLSLLEQDIHLEGSSQNNRFTYLLGVRNKNNSNLLSSQETQGNYSPSSNDIQSYLTYKLNEKWQLELLGIYSSTRFSVIPESAQKTSSVFSPFYTANLGLDIFFEGQEKDAYNTNMIGLTVIHQPTKKLKLRWMANYFNDNEKENEDIGGTYLFGERDFDRSSATFGQITNPLGAGFYQNYSRNSLNIDVWNFSHKGSLDAGKHFIQWGLTFEQNNIKDKLYQWEFQDSAGYSLPYDPAQNTNNIYSFLNSTADLSIQKYSGYLQDNINLSRTNKSVLLQLGTRFNYNSFNKEFFVTPRAQFSIKPNWNKEMIFKFAAGTYYQPPFYREYRGYDGLINPNVKSQKSLQLVAGMDYNFKKSDRPFRITTEVYYKNMWDVNPYDIDNVHIQYFGNNNAKAYAYGLETRLYTQLIKDAESWLSIGIMKTMENIDSLYYNVYKNKEGEVITATTKDQVVAQVIPTKLGWVRRPTDRLVTVGLYLQDYLSTNKNFRVHLNTIVGSNLPYNIPGSVQYRNGLTIDPYIRVDIGFSALLLDEKSTRRSHNPFSGFKSIWASFEVFNLIDRANVISYQLVKDFSNTTYAIPNRLTPRLVNFKIIGTF